MHKRKGVWLQARGRAALQAAAGHWLWHVTSAQESSEEEGSVEWKGSSFEEQSLLHALQNVNEKQKKSEDSLLGIKKKELSVPQKQKKTHNRGIMESEPRNKIQYWKTKQRKDGQKENQEVEKWRSTPRAERNKSAWLETSCREPIDL